MLRERPALTVLRPGRFGREPSAVGGDIRRPEVELPTLGGKREVYGRRWPAMSSRRAMRSGIGGWVEKNRETS